MENDDPVIRAEAEITSRISAYVDVLTVARDAEAARDFYTDDAKLLGPGFEFARSTVVREIQAAFAAGAQIQVKRHTHEFFIHGDAAYEIAKAEDTLAFPDGSSQILRNNMFIRWERGADGKWRFSRVLLSPQEGPAE